MTGADVGRPGLRRAATVVLAVVAAALTLLVLSVPSVFSTVLRGAGLWPHSDRYTALYFVQPSTVSGTTGPRSGLPVTFAVENHEAGRRTYSFRVTIGPNARTQRVLDTGTVTLAPGRLQVEAVQLRRAPRPRSLVQVRLSGGDTISYWTS